jgi:serine/threonine protein kinase HipA of HipAB toxin-antitoxin module
LALYADQHALLLEVEMSAPRYPHTVALRPGVWRLWAETLRETAHDLRARWRAHRAAREQMAAERALAALDARTRADIGLEPGGR